MKTQIFPINQLTLSQCEQVIFAVKAGAVVALATDTVYGLAADAYNESAIQRIYALKQRPSGMALQILVDSAETARKLTVWNDQADRLARAYWPGALTLILPPAKQGELLLRGFAGLGIRVPNHTGLLKLLSQLKIPLACTSANIHGRPVITSEKDLLDFCNRKVDFILTDGTLSANASSVIDLTENAVLRREGALSRQELEKTLQESLK